jgi:hypothetical protein
MSRIAIVLVVALALLGAMSVLPSDARPALATGDPSNGYLPLTPKNTWIYSMMEVEGPGPAGVEETVAITTSNMIDGKEVCLTNNYGFGVNAEPVEFFTDDLGSTCEHKDGKSALWYPWTDMGLVTIPLLASEDCMRGSVGIMYHIEEITVPAGTFHDGFLIRYDWVPCCDSGLVSETFIAGVGLVERKVLTLAGVRTWALERAFVGGQWIGGSSAPRTLATGESTWGSIKASFAE